MRIAIFSDNFYPEISGISDSIILLGQNLRENGHEIHYFVPKYSLKNYQTAKLEVKELELGKNIKIHRLFSLPYFGSPTKQARFVIPLGLCALKFHKEKFDVVYTQSPFGMGIEALLMSKILGIPLIGTNHTPIEEFTRYVPIFGKMLTKLSKKYFVWYYNQCSFVTAPYAGLLEDMKSGGLKIECKELSNPVDLKNFLPVGEKEKNELKKKNNFPENVILYSGRLAPEKQVDVILLSLVKVKENVNDFLFVVTGFGSSEENLKKMSKELGLENEVKFFGRVKEEKLVELYQASDLFVIMSTAETQSLSLMKAMATEVPAIGADARALPDYINSGGGIVVPVGDEDKLAQKIVNLLQNPQKRKEIGTKTSEFVKQFSAKKITLEWEKIFGEAIKNFKK